MSRFFSRSLVPVRARRVLSILTSTLLVASLLSLVMAPAVAPPAAAGPGTVDWFANQGGTGSADATVEVVTDAAGATYVVGYFTGTMTIGFDSLTSSLGTTDVFVAKYSDAGVPQWATRLGSGSGSDVGIDLALDPSGNVYVLGSFVTSISIGPDSLSAQGVSDGFLAKLNTAGIPQWGRRIGGTGGEVMKALAVSGASTVAVVGTYKGTIAAGGTSLTAAGGTADVFVARYNSSGSGTSARSFGSAAANDDVSDVAFAGGTDVLLYGQHDLPSSLGSFPLPDNGFTNIFLARLNADNAPLWVRTGTGPDAIGNGKIATDRNATNVAITGGFYVSMSFDGQALTASSGRDGFVFQANISNGAVNYGRRIGGTGNDVANAVAYDDSGNFVVGLTFRGTLSFGGVAHAGGSSGDGLLVLFARTGEERFSIKLASAASDDLWGVSVTSDGDLSVAGSAGGAFTIGSSNYGLVDQQGFVVRIGDPVADTASSRYFAAPTPTRIFDSRDGSPFGPGQTRPLQLTGVSTPGGTTAVVLNVTGTGATVPTHVTLFPFGGSTPSNSNLNLVPGETAANLVTVKVSGSGWISIFNNSGNAHVIIDLVGWYRDDVSGSRLTGITPVRILDSRDGTGGFSTPWGPGVERAVTASNAYGIPQTATAVVVNLTAVAPSAPTHLTLWPDGTPIPNTSTLNVSAGATRPNLAIVRLSNGKIRIRNNAGSTHVLADVVGYFTTTAGNGDFAAVPPVRVADSRNGFGGFDGPYPAGAERLLTVAGVANVPATARAVVLNVTVTGPTAPSHLTVWPTGVAKPTASNLNVVPGQTVPNAVIVKVGSNGRISLANNSGTAHVIVDVVGWYD